MRSAPAVALAWHDVTCPQAEGCPDRGLHAADSIVASTILPRFLVRLEELTPIEQSRSAGAAGTAGEGYRTVS